MGSVVEWAKARRILCVRLDGIGDLLMTTPAIRALKAGEADREIALLTSRSGSAVAHMIEECDRHIVYEAPWLKATRAPNPKYDAEFIKRLSREGFDAAVIFTVCTQSALPAAMLCYLAGIPLRLGYCRENPYFLLTDWIQESDSIGSCRHEVLRQLELAQAAGASPDGKALRIRIPEESRENVHGLLKDVGVSRNGKWIVLHPGGTAPSRRYPAEQYREVASELSKAHGFRVIVTGDDTERELCEALIQGLGDMAVCVAGRLGLGELAALIEQAPVIVTNNSAPAHIGAATGTPVVDLYALTNPQHTPWMVDSRVLNVDVPCRNCLRSVCPERHGKCLRLVSPAAVTAAVLELYSGRNGGIHADARDQCRLS